MKGKGIHFGLQIHRVRSLCIRYWWIVAITMLLGSSYQAFRISMIPIKYLSNARMMVSGHLSIPQGEIYSEELTNFYGTQSAMMKSPDTVAAAVARVKALHPEIAVDDGASVEAFQEPRTSIFDLSVVSNNPEYAQALLDSVMDTYLSLKKGRKTETADEAVSEIAEEISKLDGEIKDDDQKLLDFQKANNVVFIEEQSSNAGNYLVGLNNEAARLTKEHDLLALENSDGLADSSVAASSPDPGAAGTAITSQKQELERLKILQQHLAKFLRPEHPKMIALSDSINQQTAFLNSLTVENQQARLEHQKSLELQIQNLQAQITEWNKKSLDLNQSLGIYEQLKSKVTREQALYSQLASSIQSVNLNKSIDQDDVTKLQSASPAGPIRPDYVREIGEGGLFGTILGLAIVYLINRLDDKIDSPLEMETSFAYPLIGQIPRAVQNRKTRQVPLLVDRDQRFILAESYCNIRSALIFQNGADENAKVGRFRSLLVTSASPGEGKSTISANLALTFAHAGNRVLLVDADLRRGVLHRHFEVSQSPGLSNFLQQEIGWRAVVQKTDLDTLDVIPRGDLSHRPGALLLGAVSNLIMKESAAEYDLVIWDSAPLLAADDTANICSKVDGIVFVTRARFSSIHSIASALDILVKRGGTIAGLILNAVDPSQPGYYDRYRYKAYYSSSTGS